MSVYNDAERTYAWLDTLFINNPNVPGSRIPQPENLEFPATLPTTKEETDLRNSMYSFQAIQNAYRVLFLCSLDDEPSRTESILHAHAEYFLKKAYAMWNLSGSRREEFERNLKMYANTTISELFAMNAPVCRVGTNEVLALQDMHAELEAVRTQNAVLRAEIERHTMTIEELKLKLEESDARDRYFSQNLADSIQGAIAEQKAKYEYLRANTDTIVAAATQEQQVTLQRTLKLLGECQADFTRLQSKHEAEAVVSRQRLTLLEEGGAIIRKAEARLEACGCGETDKSDNCTIM
jgi:hypothetical protein